ncbi:HAD-IIB family hydrolase [Enterococcus alishanensis]|uniref:Cof-type HAD-IIB family hydrolase n=1 Tax=Enterococcus alishanensis TaxID=1303817 RepID=A0ABS6T9X5_9ENTE|nr:HAD family hydrolase [Enterococcus alishanensis]MBV7389707.1 Cof-type HAD-IIB family hydrolase [Enterococcus alishanensis]
MIRLVLTDLDGTFLNSQSLFDEKLYLKVRKMMQEKGIIFAPVTGKQAERVEELFVNVGFEDLWILGDSATRIKHQGKIVYQDLLPNRIGLKMIETLQQIPHQTIIACTEEAAFILKDTPEADLFFVNGSYQVVKFVDKYDQISDDFIKITVLDNQLRTFETVKLLEQYQDQAYFVASEPRWIDIAQLNVHKGTTVQELQKLLGISKSETMAFGDGLNDIELFAEADYSFAVKNAFAETKAAANYQVNLSNDENAVLVTLAKMLAI